LILLDYRMPKLDGCELAKFFAADYSLRHVPVLFMSGSPQGEILERTCPRTYQVFQKPLCIPMIVDCIDELVDARNK
jgi:CheY-like chemotaxis protein